MPKKQPILPNNFSSESNSVENCAETGHVLHPDVPPRPLQHDITTDSMPEGSYQPLPLEPALSLSKGRGSRGRSPEAPPAIASVGASHETPNPAGNVLTAVVVPLYRTRERG